MQDGLPPVLNPRAYVSPSGEYALHVNPSNRHGQGEANYLLTRKGAIVWERKHPFTFWEAGVTNDGTAAGYAYSNGPQGWGKESGYGYFEAAILGPTGKPRLHRKVKRVETRVLHGPPLPIAQALVVNSANDRLVVRVYEDRGGAFGYSADWTYELSTGRTAKLVAPGMPDEKDRNTVEARSIAGTPLTLLHWWRYSEGDIGAYFTLLDPAGKPVWNLELPRDYSTSGDKEAQDRLRDDIRQTGAILRANQGRRFTLRFVADKQRVTFAVVMGEGGTWRIAEVGREPYVPGGKAVRFAMPEVRLRQLDRIELQGSGPQAQHPIRSIHSPVAAGSGRLAFLRREDRTDLVVVEESGKILHTVPLDSIPRRNNDTFCGLLWREETRFLVFVERRAEDSDKVSTEAYQVDARTASIGKLEGFRCDWLRSVAALPDGGFALLATERREYSMQDGIYAYDARGRQKWALGTYNYGAKSLTTLPDETVAVLDGAGKVIHLYRHGKHLRAISLKVVWNSDWSYPTTILAGPKGDFLVYGSLERPPLVWMNLRGEVLRTSTPRYANGEEIDNPGMCLMPDGGLWVSDTYSLLRIDEKGRVMKRLGEEPRPGVLRNIVEVAIYPNGRILAADERTNAVHVFDARGRWQAVCKPIKSEQERPHWTRSLRTEIELGPNDTFAVGDEWFGVRGTWEDKPAGFQMSRERIRPLQRRPDGTWLEEIEAWAVAPDSTLALLDGQNIINHPERNYYLSIYSAKDAPERMVPLPEKLGWAPKVAYDGKMLIVTGPAGIYGFRANGETLWHFPLPSDNPDRYLWHPFLTESGRTLCLYDSRRTIYRYALP
jgi:hypothetical protein